MLGKYFEFVLLLQLLKLGFAGYNSGRRCCVCIWDKHLIFSCLNQLLIEARKACFLCLHNLADLIVTLSELLQCCRHLFLFFCSSLPAWHTIVWLKEGVSQHMRYFSFMLLRQGDIVLVLELFHYCCDVSRSRSRSSYVVISLRSWKASCPLGRNCRLRFVWPHF